MLENPGRAYGLAFVPKTKAPDGATPELVLTSHQRDKAHLEEWLLKMESALGRAATEYLTQDLVFIWPGLGQLTLDVLPESTISRIGYRACGYTTLEGDELQIRFPLREASAKETALSIAVLLQALNGIPRETRVSNRQQMLDITTRCMRSGQYAHPIFGYVYPAARSWLLKQGAGPLQDSVHEAMREAWKALAPFNLHSYADECNAGVTKDGRFMFGCFGNACDVSIYPDSGWTDDPENFCPFSCHNLDIAYQQLTLLAGLATMIALMEEEQQ